MKASRDVDLTRHLDFQKEEPKMRSIQLKQKETYDYKRYHEVKDEPTQTTISNFQSTVGDFFNGFFTTDANFTYTNSLITPYSPFLKKIEERVCWRELYRDPDVFVQPRSFEEAIEHIKHLHFPLGSKYDRMATRQEIKTEIARNSTCECCGRPIKLGNNCLKGFDGLCSKCATTFYKSTKKVCWR